MRRSRMRPRGTIAARVALVAGLLAAVLLVSGAFLVRAALHSAQLDATQQLADVQAAQIIDATRSGVTLSGAFGSLPYELVRSDGALVASSPELVDAEADGPVMPPPPREARQTGGEVWTADVPSGPLAGRSLVVSNTLRASSIPIGTVGFLPGGPFADPDDAAYRAYVFVTTADADAAVATIDPYLWSGVVLTVVLLAGTAAVTARRSLRPVEQMRQAAAAISGAPDGARVRVPDVADELSSLATTLNAMLARIDEAATRQRRFAADAAHELRSPLTSLMTALDIARAHPYAMPPERTLAHVHAEARRLQELADELLDLTAAAAAPVSQQETCPDAGAVLDDVLAELRARSPRVGIALTGTPTRPAPVQLGAGGLRRVLTNLLDNAVRHARTGVTVTMQADTGAHTVVIEVGNDGPPIPQEDLTRVFEPFVRLDESRSRETGGAGLGLAIAREIVTRAGGTLTATSTSMRTAFTATLPQ